MRRLIGLRFFDVVPREATHRDIALRKRNLDAGRVVGLLDASSIFPRNRPLLERECLHANANGDRRVAEGLDSDNLDRLQHEGAKLHRRLHFVGRGLQDRHHIVGVVFVRHTDIEQGIRIVLGQIRQRGDTAARKDVDDAALVAQHDGPEVDRLDQPARAVDLSHVPNAHLILENEEESADDVFYQCLRAEPDGESKDARAGQDRHDVDAKFLQDGEHRDRDNRHADQIIEHVDQCACPLAALHPDLVIVVHDGLKTAQTCAQYAEQEPREAKNQQHTQATCQQPGEGGTQREIPLGSLMDDVAQGIHGTRIQKGRGWCRNTSPSSRTALIGLRFSSVAGGCPTNPLRSGGSVRSA